MDRSIWENRKKLHFYDKKPTFFIKYQTSTLARPTICQNLRSFGQETTEIRPFIANSRSDFQSPKKWSGQARVKEDLELLKLRC